MQATRLSQLTQPLDGKLIGDDTAVGDISIDTRTINSGDCFIAIKGPNFDGHEFIAEAFAKGATAAIVERPMPVGISQLIVSNTDQALTNIAILHRQSIDIPIISVTGSCGKTTTKSMIASIMSHMGFVHAGKKSFNNHYGVPLTLLGIDSTQHDYAVVEMGANHQGEIAQLTAITRPNIAVITMAAPVHLEGFGSIEGVAAGKGEIFQGLPEEGIAIINQEDFYAEYWKKLCSGKTIKTFGYSQAADFWADDITVDAEQHPKFCLHTPNGEMSITLPLLGEHNINNALAAAAAAATASAGADLKAIQKGLQAMTPVDKRLIKRVGRLGIEILDDSYNANPTGLKAALKVLANSNKQKILVLGEMAELGEKAQEFHQQLGLQAKQHGVAELYALGKLTEHTVAAFGEGGHYFTEQKTLIERLVKNIVPNMCVLVKGSNCNRLDKVVDALLEV